MLHVANDGIVPVGNIQRPVLTNDGVGGAEVAIGAVEQFDAWCSPDLTELSILAHVGVSATFDFDIHGSDKLVPIEKFNLPVVESLLKTFAIPNSKLRDFNGSREVTLHPWIILSFGMREIAFIAIGKQ